MYRKPILSSIALFFLAASSANAAPSEFERPHRILARSPHLWLRQDTGVYGTCTSTCEPIDGLIDACGNSDACICSPTLTDPFAACARCVYKMVGDKSLTADMEKSWNDLVAGCTAAGYPMVGNTSIDGSVQSDSSPSSTPAAAAPASPVPASPTASTPASSTQTPSNGAIRMSSSIVSSVVIPFGALALLL